MILPIRIFNQTQGQAFMREREVEPINKHWSLLTEGQHYYLIHNASGMHLFWHEQREVVETAGTMLEDIHDPGTQQRLMQQVRWWSLISIHHKTTLNR